MEDFLKIQKAPFWIEALGTSLENPNASVLHPCHIISRRMQRATKVPKSALKRMPSFSEEESEGEANRKLEKPKEPVTLQKVFVRTATAVVCSLLYLGLLQTGHLYCIISIMLVQVQSFC